MEERIKELLCKPLYKDNFPIWVEEIIEEKQKLVELFQDPIFKPIFLKINIKELMEKINDGQALVGLLKGGFVLNDNKQLELSAFFKNFKKKVKKLKKIKKNYKYLNKIYKNKKIKKKK